MASRTTLILILVALVVAACAASQISPPIAHHPKHVPGVVVEAPEPDKKPISRPKPKAAPATPMPAQPPDPGPAPCTGIVADNLKNTITAKLDCLEQANKDLNPKP